MIKKGFIFLDLLCGLLILGFLAPIILSSTLTLSHFMISLQKTTLTYLEVYNKINSLHYSNELPSQGHLFKTFNIYHCLECKAPIYWIH